MTVQLASPPTTPATVPANAPWSVVARLARRVCWAGASRTVTFFLLVALPLTVVVSAMIAVNSARTTQTQSIQENTGGAWAAADLPGLHPTPPDMSKVALAAGLRLVTTRIDVYQYPVAHAGTTVSTFLREADWSGYQHDALYRTVTGSIPSAPSTAAVSTALAAKLGARIGDRIELGYDSSHPIEVVGTYVDRRSTHTFGLLLGAGTFVQLKPSAAVRANDLVSPRYTLMIDTTLPPSRAVALLPRWESILLAEQFEESDPIFIREPVLLAAPVLLLLLVLLACATLLRLRRLTNDYAVIAALGLHGRQVTTSVALSFLAVIGGAAVLAVGAGMAVAGWTAPLLAGLLNRELSGGALIPWTALGVLIGAVLLIAAVTGAAAGAYINRQVRTGAAARPVTDAVPVLGRRSRWRTAAQLVLAAALITSLLYLDGEEATAAFLSTGLMTAFLAVTAPDLISMVGAIARRPTSVRLGSLLARRDTGRSIAVTAAVIAAVTLPVGIFVSAASIDAWNRQVYNTSSTTAPADTVRLMVRGTQPTTAILADLSAAAGGSPALPQNILTQKKSNNPGGAKAIGAGPQRRWILVIDDPAQLTAMSGYVPTAADTAALKQRKVLVMTTGGPISSIPVDAAPSTLPAARATGPLALAANYTPYAILRTAAPTGAGVFLNYVWFTGAADHYPEIVAAATKYGILPSSFTIARGPTPSLTGLLGALLYIGVGLAALVTIACMATALRERRFMVRQFGILGAPDRVRRLIGATSIATPVLVGGIFGAFSGIFVAYIRHLNGPFPLTIPWDQILLVLVATLVLAASSLLVGAGRIGPPVRTSAN